MALSGLRGLNLSVAPSGPFGGIILADQDVVPDNFRPGVLDRLQIEPPTLSSINPRIICCSIIGCSSTDSSSHQTACSQYQVDAMLREGRAMQFHPPERKKWVSMDKSLPRPEEASREIGG